MAIKVSDSASITKRHGGASSSGEPYRQFGNDTLQGQALPDAPDLASLESRNATVAHGANMQVINVASDIARDQVKNYRVFKEAEDRARVEESLIGASKERSEIEKSALNEMNVGNHGVDYYEREVEQRIGALEEGTKAQLNLSTAWGRKYYDDKYRMFRGRVQSDNMAVANKMRTNKVIQQTDTAVEGVVWKAANAQDMNEVFESFTEIDQAMIQRQAVDPTMDDLMREEVSRQQKQRSLATYFDAMSSTGVDGAERAIDAFENLDPDLKAGLYTAEELAATDKALKSALRAHVSDQYATERLARQKQTQAQNTQAHAWEVGISTDENVGFEPTMHNLRQDLIDEKISDAQYRLLENKLTGNRDLDEAQTGLVDSVLNNARVLDYKTTGDKKAVQTYVDKVLFPSIAEQTKDLNPQEAATVGSNLLVNFYRDVGIVDATRLTEINRGLYSEDPTIVNATAMFTRDLINVSPHLASQVPEQAKDIARLIDTGVDPIQASKTIQETSSLSKDEVKMYDRRMRGESTFGEFTASLDTEVDGFFENKFNAEEYHNAATREAAHADYTNMYTQFYRQSKGNAEYASKRAQDNITAKYGVTNIYGEPRVMAYPPENLFNQGKPAKWMGVQLAKEMAAEGYAPGSYSLAPSRFTLNPPKGQTPQYMVVDPDTGIPLRSDNNELMTWNPERGVDPEIEEIILDEEKLNNEQQYFLDKADQLNVNEYKEKERLKEEAQQEELRRARRKQQFSDKAGMTKAERKKANSDSAKNFSY